MTAPDVDQRPRKDPHLVVTKGVASNVELDQPPSLFARWQVGVVYVALGAEIPKGAPCMRCPACVERKLSKSCSPVSSSAA